MILNLHPMKKIYTMLCALFLLSGLLYSCNSDDPNEDIITDREEIIGAVKNLRADTGTEKNEIIISWLNADDNSLAKVEIVYNTKYTNTKSSYNPTLVDAESGKEGQCSIVVPDDITYDIAVTSISNKGQRSKTKTITAKPSSGIRTEVPEFFLRADTLMKSMMEKCLGGPRDNWRAYPNPTGPYWDGDATVWGQGGGFSAFAAMREASSKTADYQSEYKALDSRMISSIDKFRIIDSRNQVEGYSVYPASGNERLYDDNVWIGLDMIDLYLLTGDNKIFTRANIVWKYLLTGMAEDGGVYWRELPEKSTSKHACSSAPTAVMATKMYLATGDVEYLDKAKKIYAWCINNLQDTDFLICDLQRADGSIDKAKYSYNSGEVVQAGALLYKITGEIHYLNEAQQIASAMYEKWFSRFYSNVLGRQIMMIDGHTWFNAVALRGFIELYKLDGNRKYVSGYEDMLDHAWQSTCRNKTLDFLSYDNFRGGINQTSWDILHLGATVEMIARLSSLKMDEAVH